MAEFDLASAKPVFDLQGALSQTDKALGLPAGFSAAQIKVESGFRPDAVSPAGAMGLAQVMPDTLKAVSQRLGRDLDPMNPADAVQIHREVMRENLAKFGSADKALMAYNGGWDPSKWGNPETRAYVGKVSAAFKGENPAMAAVGKAVGAVMPSAQAGEGFDLATAKPAFDLATARPVRPSAETQVANAKAQGQRELIDSMSPFERGAAGAGKAVYDLARGAGQWLGLVDRADVAESRRLDAPLMETTAAKVGNVAGNVLALAPAAFVPGANSLLVGAGLGAATGALQPSTSTRETLTNVSLGAAGGAIVPAATTAIRTARAAAEPFYETGRNAIVGRALNRAAGQDAGAVAARLTEAAEIVPGSVPTVGQAAANPGIAALERAATAGNPEVTNAVAARMAQQNEARVGVLDTLASTEAQRLAVDKARKAAAAPLYKAASGQSVAVDDTLQELLKRPSVQQAVGRAQKLAQEEGRTFGMTAPAPGKPGMSIVDEAGNVLVDLSKPAAPGKITGQTLQDLKMAMDALLKDPTSGIAGREAVNVESTRNALVKWMESNIRAFKTARTSYSANSQPLNQMDIAGAIRDRAVNPLTGNLQAGRYARAITDEGLPARATNFPAATFENSLTPSAQGQLNSLLKDLQRAHAAQNAGRGVGSDTVQKLAYTNVLDQSGVPTLLRNFAPAQIVGNVAGRVADTAYGRANRELSARLAQVMLDPAEAARLMTQATPRELNQLLRLTQRGASGLAISAPAAANALQ